MPMPLFSLCFPAESARLLTRELAVWATRAAARQPLAGVAEDHGVERRAPRGFPEPPLAGLSDEPSVECGLAHCRSTRGWCGRRPDELLQLGTRRTGQTRQLAERAQPLEDAGTAGDVGPPLEHAGDRRHRAEQLGIAAAARPSA